METPFEQLKQAAIMELISLCFAIMRRVEGEVGKKLFEGSVSIVKRADENSSTPVEWAAKLPRLHMTFQTNLNNMFPTNQAMKEHFRRSGIDLGFDYEVGY